jgi:hypothetical protein
VHHGLLVPGLVVAQRAGLAEFGLEQRLAEAGQVPVAEDAEAAGEQRPLYPVALAALGRQEPDYGLPTVSRSVILPPSRALRTVAPEARY